MAIAGDLQRSLACRSSPRRGADAASAPEEVDVPGFDFHELKGFKPARYTIHVNGPWCLTFEFEDGDACRVDLEQYH
jgi:toxin HigB-1